MATAAASPPIETFDALHERLGRVPLSRIRLKPPPGTATEEDLSKPHGRRCELIDGVLVEKPVGDRESLLAHYLGRRLGDIVDPDDLGVILGADGYFRLGEKQLRAPDASFTPWSAFPQEGETPADAYWSVAPALAVEVLSPDNTVAEMDRKIGEFFAEGTKLFWVIDPESKSAKVYTSAKRFKQLDETGTLDCGKVLPGFKLPLADLFAATKRRKKKPR